MLNLLKGDLYRLFHSKYYKNAFIATIVIGIVALLLGEVRIMSFTTPEGIQYGFNIGAEYGENYLEFLKSALGTAICMYIVGISLTSSIMINKANNGSLKNIVSYGYERWKILSSSVISLIMGMAILIVINFAIVMTGYVILGRPTGVTIELLYLTVKSIGAYILICGTSIGIYGVITFLLPSASIISILAVVEIWGLTMVGHMLSESYINFIPILLLRNLASGVENISFMTVGFWMILMIAVVLDIGRMIFNKFEIK
ncbi:MAG: hypothetical protein ACRDDY_07465 [Clostridium sp.]|uniref:hypothetical protein n=1 Tax=Clostridium sp. TaxID=1506 RepID=UPI003EE6B08D